MLSPHCKAQVTADIRYGNGVCLLFLGCSAGQTACIHLVLLVLAASPMQYWLWVVHCHGTLCCAWYASCNRSDVDFVLLQSLTYCAWTPVSQALR